MLRTIWQNVFFDGSISETIAVLEDDGAAYVYQRIEDDAGAETKMIEVPARMQRQLGAALIAAAAPVIDAAQADNPMEGSMARAAYCPHPAPGAVWNPSVHGVRIPTMLERSALYDMDGSDCWGWCEKQGLPTGVVVPAAVATLYQRAYATRTTAASRLDVKAAKAMLREAAKVMAGLTVPVLRL